MRRAAAWVLMYWCLIGRAMAGEVAWFVTADDKDSWAQAIAEQWTQRTGHQVRWVLGQHAEGARMVACGLADLAISDRGRLVTQDKKVRPSEQALTALPFLFDAAAFVVGDTNPLHSVDAQLLRHAVQNPNANWASLGGEDLPLSLHLPDFPLAAERRLLQHWLSDSAVIAWSELAHTDETAADIAKKSLQIENMLGVASWYATRRVPARTLMIDKTELSYQTLKNGEYPLIYPLFLVYSGNEAAKSLAEFVLSPLNEALFAQHEMVRYQEPAAQSRWLKLSGEWLEAMPVQARIKVP